MVLVSKERLAWLVVEGTVGSLKSEPRGTRGLQRSISS